MSGLPTLRIPPTRPKTQNHRCRIVDVPSSHPYPDLCLCVFCTLSSLEIVHTSGRIGTSLFSLLPTVKKSNHKYVNVKWTPWSTGLLFFSQKQWFLSAGSMTSQPSLSLEANWTAFVDHSEASKMTELFNIPGLVYFMSAMQLLHLANIPSNHKLVELGNFQERRKAYWQFKADSFCGRTLCPNLSTKLILCSCTFERPIRFSLWGMQGGKTSFVLLQQPLGFLNI